MFVATWFRTVLAKKPKNLGKKLKFVFYQSYGFLAITFQPETLESQSKAQKTGFQ